MSTCLCLQLAIRLCSVGVQMQQTETSAIFVTWWLKATFQEPGENAAASAIGGAWNVGTRWFIGERETNIC